MKVQNTINQYADYMRQIKFRMSVIVRCIKSNQAGNSLTGFRETDIDLCYLQLRKCLELIMFSSVIAHHSFGVELSKHLRNKEYSASQIIKKLKRVYPKYYPTPVRESDSSNGIRKVEKINEGYLTEPEFCKLYDKVCGGILHASRPDPYVDNIDEHFAEINRYHNKLICLLNYHWIHISDEVALAVLMKTKGNDDVQVARMNAVPK